MAIDAAAATPQYSGNFIPEIWSGNLLVKFYAACTMAAISNTDYEGEIKKKGDKVIIRTTPTGTIKDYVKNQELEIEHPDSDPIELPIDHAKYFNFICDEIDAYQADIPLMDDWSKDYGQQMKIKIETGVFADVYTDAATYNKGNTAGYISRGFHFGATAAPRVVTSENVLEIIIDCGTALTEYNCPEEDRWIVIPAWMAGIIKKSDIKDASLTGDSQSTLRNGQIGRIDEFTLYKSNLLASATDTGFTCYHAMAGQRHALSFAAQMTRMRSLETSRTFGTLISGLNVYGYKVLKPEALIDLYVRK